jgi:hypothetical protein
MKTELRFGPDNTGIIIEKGKISFNTTSYGTSTSLSVAEWRRMVAIVESVLEINGDAE